jgi:hypothetical protein
MLVCWEQSAGGFQEEDFDTKVEDENCVTYKPHMRGNEEEEQMEDFEIKTIMTLDLKMRNKLLSDNYRSEESKIQKSKIDISTISIKLVDVYAHPSNVWA